jgi:hypothetical protein
VMAHFREGGWECDPKGRAHGASFVAARGGYHIGVGLVDARHDPVWFYVDRLLAGFHLHGVRVLLMTGLPGMGRVERRGGYVEVRLTGPVHVGGQG